MGTPKSGKSSIKKVVFEKIFPHETTYIPPTLEIETLEVKSIEYCTLNIYEIPYTFKYNKKTPEEEKYFLNCTMIIYILDCQKLDDKSNEFEYFEKEVVTILKYNNKI